MSWAGGYTRKDRFGATVWVIKAARGHQRYSITLKVTSEAEALAELALFNRDPVGFRGARTKSGLALTEELTAEFFHAMLHGDPQYRVVERHARSVKHYLQWWEEALCGRPLGSVTLQEYRDLVRTIRKAKRLRIAALRALTHWLRREGRLSSAEDASRDLEIPTTNVKRASKAVGYTIEEFDRLYAHVLPSSMDGRGDGGHAQAVRDVLTLRALCGIHHSEIERIAAGDRKVQRLKGQGEIAGFVLFQHKKGTPHPQALCAKALAAVERLQARGRAPADRVVNEAVERASALSGVPRRTPGELRHSFITWALTVGREVRPVDAGVSLDTVKRVVGHTSVGTTEVYNASVPPLVVLPLKLENKLDPEYVKPKVLSLVGGSS